MVIAYGSRTTLSTDLRYLLHDEVVKLVTSIQLPLCRDYAVSKILCSSRSCSQHPSFRSNFLQIVQIPTNEMYIDDDFQIYLTFRRENIYPPGGKFSYKIIVFLGNARGCIFRTDGGEGKKNRTRGTGTRGAICSSFALITATKCLAREALVVSSATRRRPWAISTQVDPKRTTRNWNRSFKHSCESWWSKMLEDSLQISYKTCKRNQ